MSGKKSINASLKKLTLEEEKARLEIAIKESTLEVQ